MNRSTRNLAAALPMLCIAPLWAQFAPSAPPVPTISLGTRLVQIPTLVKTSVGDLVYSLSFSDFLVTDDGVPQTVTVDADSPHPLSLVILMQTGAPAAREFKSYRRLGASLASLLAGSHNQAAIVAFDSKVEGATPFTSDIAQWSEALEQPEEGDHGAAILDALSYALRLLDNQPAANRRAILLLSGPRDEGSKISPKDILSKAGETNTAIYALTFAPEETAFKDAFKNPRLNPPIDTGAGSFQAYFDLGAPLGMILGAMRKNTTAELARFTGGEAAGFTTEKTLADDLNTLANHLHNGYLLSFTPTSDRPGLHTLQVRIRDHPGLIVSARSSYWATPSQ